MTIPTEQDWHFIDPQNVAVITTNKILSRERAILYVSHDENDGMWQFHSQQEISGDEPKVVSLGSIVKLDPSVKDLADLPLGWIAVRENSNSRWKYFKKMQNK